MTAGDNDYHAIDLSAYCNAGVEVLGGDPAAVPVGDQLFHGLPFHIGEADRAVVLFGGDGVSSSVNIPINQTAYKVIVAHRLLNTQLMLGGPVGVAVATYTFHLSDGATYEVPIRERFEIGDVGAWGQTPFLARSDQHDLLRDRWSGPWGDAGYRQSESRAGASRAYYLWCWTNPAPEVSIVRLEITPKPGERFVLAAITLGL